MYDRQTNSKNNTDAVSSSKFVLSDKNINIKVKIQDIHCIITSYTLTSVLIITKNRSVIFRFLNAFVFLFCLHQVKINKPGSISN